MNSRKALIDYVIGNEFISKPELQQKFINLLNKHEQALQLQKTGVMRSNCIDESPEPRINVNRFNNDDYDENGYFLR